MKSSPGLLTLALLVFASVAFSSPSIADVADFYRGKQIRIVVGSDAGGGYDAYARTIAAHLGRFISGNPTFVVQNMPGVGSLLAVNHVTNVAPKDGTTIGAINPSAVTAPLFRPDQAKFDARRLNWLGTPVTITYTIVAWHTAPVQRFEDLFTTELLVASAGGASRTLPVLANGILGTKFKVIMGYKSASASMLAIERGEVQGNGGEALTNLKAVHADYLRDKTLRIIGTYGLRSNQELAGVPMVINFAKTDEQRAALKLVLSSQDIGWPYVMASDVPAERVQAMRRALDATMKDPDFLADAVKRKLDISPLSGEEQAELVDQTLATPKNVVELVKGIVGDQ